MQIKFLLQIVLTILIANAVSGQNEAMTSYEKKTLDSLYLDGEFEAGIHYGDSLLDFRPGLTPQDSGYIFKYLGVMNAAKPGYKEVAKNYFWKLLDLEP